MTERTSLDTTTLSDLTACNQIYVQGSLRQSPTVY